MQIERSAPRMKEFPRDRMEVILAWINSLAGDSRLMIIIAGSRIDELVKSLLQSALIHEPGGNDSLFGHDRPLGSFSSRILLAYRLGLLNRDFESFLQTLRKLRNDAAHASEQMDLAQPPHLDRIIHLQTLASASPMWSGIAKLDLNPKINPARSLFASVAIAVLALEVSNLMIKPFENKIKCGFDLVQIIEDGG
jgi:hypothetical protein